MATNALRQLLKSFCINSPWIYAVLWKLRHWSPMSLTWEDGYCAYPIPTEFVESISCDVLSNSEIIRSDCETSTNDGCFEGYSIGLVVANMSTLKYAGREGVVGKLAYTGKHCWVSCDDVFTGKANSKLVPECPEEWLLQFASGIKTIVLIPVLPHGVLQLGSLEMVAEDLSLLAYVKDRFAKNIPAQLPSLLISSLLEKLEQSSSASISLLNSEDLNAVNSVEPNKLLALDQIVPLSDIQNSFPIDLREGLESESENKSGVPPVSLSGVSSPLSKSMCSNQLARGESELFGLCNCKEELQAYPDFNAYIVGDHGESLEGDTNPFPAMDLLAPPFGDYNVDDAGFLKDCELYNALGPAFQRQSNEYLWESSFWSEEAFNDLFDGIEPLLSAKVGDAEYMLQAGAAHVYDGSVDIANRSNHVITTTGQLPFSSQPQTVMEESIPLSRLTSAFAGGAQNNSNSKVSASKSTVSALTDSENPGKDCYHVQSRKGHRQSSINKRKSRPGDNPKPRPRDRQMIQDRLKELRELVPNGTKYSIDALLDQTVKHMLYLRSVTKQAEKMRQWVHREVTCRNNARSSEIKDDYQNGTSWAFEIGNELKVCPIVVEDLAYPGHLLIEMLCNEHALFLEIAQVIRSFNLTILKGVMESCSNNTWAHFIVETCRGFHRLDIFWPLMQLLQRQKNHISCKI